MRIPHSRSTSHSNLKSTLTLPPPSNFTANRVWSLPASNDVDKSGNTSSSKSQLWRENSVVSGRDNSPELCRGPLVFQGYVALFKDLVGLYDLLPPECVLAASLAESGVLGVIQGRGHHHGKNQRCLGFGNFDVCLVTISISLFSVLILYLCIGLGPGGQLVTGCLVL